MARGHRLNISIVLAAVHGLLGLPGRCARSSLHSLVPFAPLSPSLISILASVDVKQKVYIHSQWPNCVEIPSTKLWISDIPLLCANEDIESALSRLGIVLRSKLIQEKNRNGDGKLTRFFTGRRFVFMFPLE